MEIGAMEGILPRSVPDGFEDASALGFEGVEIDVDGHEEHDDLVWTSGGRTELRSRAAATGIEIPSLCLGFLNEGGLNAEDGDERERAKDAVVRAVDAAAALDAPDVLVPFFGDAEIESGTDRERVADALADVADAADAANVTLALETSLSAEGDLDLLDRIDTPGVGVYYDTGNAAAEGRDPAEEIRTLGDRMARIHFKDRTVSGESVPLGEGAVDFGAVHEALDEVGYDGWIVLETPAGEDALDSAGENRRFVRRLID